MLQSHARAIRHSDPGIVTCCHHINQIVTIPRTGNPSFRPRRLLRWQAAVRHVTIPRTGNPSFRPRDRYLLSPHQPDRYNPTHGQSVIPTKKSHYMTGSSHTSYNPTHGQSVIPTQGSLLAVTTSTRSLQSHARAIRHSDAILPVWQKGQ